MKLKRAARQVIGFDYGTDFKHTDFRRHPELYRIGRGEQGVLLVEPYKSELLPHWRFKTPPIAAESAGKIFQLYEGYKAAGDFVGMDMARKYLQMGWTRAMRYANHASGKKYVGPVPRSKRGRSGAHGRPVAPLQLDSSKRKSAMIFRRHLNAVLRDETYKAMRAEHTKRYEQSVRPAAKVSAK